MTETFIVVVVLYYPVLRLCGVSSALCLLPSLLQCSPVTLDVSYLIQFSCPQAFSLLEFCLSGFGALQSLLSRVFCIASWDSLSGLCASWDNLSSFPSLSSGRCTLGRPVWPVVGYPLLGVHPNITIVKLIAIGYCCNCLDGQLNY